MELKQYTVLPDWNDYLEAYRITMGHEGGWNHVAGDNGGETYCGIARKFWPNWPGWAIVDRNKPLRHGQIIKDESLNLMLLVFYYDNFWAKVGASKMDDKEYAKKQFDRAINFGVSEAIKQAQRTVGMDDTGKLTPALIEAINNPDKHLLG